MEAFLLFALLMVSGAAGLWALTYGHSMVAREQFLLEMGRLRDAVEDDVFAGELPDTDAVQFLWAKAHMLAAHPEAISFSRMIATVKLGPPKGKRLVPSHGELTPAQRKRMHAYDAQFIDIVATYISRGSRLWFVFPIVGLLPERGKRGSKRTEPTKVAQQYVMIMDRSSEKTPRGPRISGSLIPH